MINNPLFKIMFGILVVVAALNKLALHFYLYWLVWWFDILMHILGGFWVMLAVLWLISFAWSKLLQQPSWLMFIFALLVTLIVGLLWEIFELEFGISQLQAPDFVVDTITDIIMDIIGAVLAYGYAYPKIKPTPSQS